MPCDAVAEDEQDLRGEQDHPTGEDEGVRVEDLGRGRIFVLKMMEVEAEANDHAEPEDGEPDGRGGSVVPCAPGPAYMPNRSGPL
jgi:hypothetical protein